MLTASFLIALNFQTEKSIDSKFNGERFSKKLFEKRCLKGVFKIEIQKDVQNGDSKRCSKWRFKKMFKI
jgi:hypothetical protein